MLTKHLDVTYALVWSVAIANILGAGICFLFANQLAKIAIIRIGVLAPLIVGVVFVGVYQSSASWGDLIALLVFGVIGWIMKRMNWPRPPVILGFVLGALFERYMYISVQRYGFDWLGFPIVVAIMAVGLYGMLSPIIGNIRRERRRLGGRARLVFGRAEKLATAGERVHLDRDRGVRRGLRLLARLAARRASGARHGGDRRHPVRGAAFRRQLHPPRPGSGRAAAAARDRSRRRTNRRSTCWRGSASARFWGAPPISSAGACSTSARPG